MEDLEVDTGLTEYTFDWKNPTAQMLGRWQPWHEGHRELFKRAYNMCGQVCIMIRDVPKNREANSRVPGQDDNPFEFYEAQSMIIEDLLKEGFTIGQEYVIMHVPNIVDISYGRGVGYTFTEHDLGKEIHDISATKIRAKLRESGELASKP
ncbi:MAG: cytidyltransferase [Porticoccaceae bacterium]|nr:cytidyltransferase [Porticoccaceae bacterium]